MSMDGMDIVKLVNENHLTKFNDLTVVSDSETTSSTSWKRIVGIQQFTIVFDRYDSGVSIKTTERERRGSSRSLIRYVCIRS